MYYEILNVANFPYKATELVRLLKTFKFWGFSKQRWVCGKNNSKIEKCAEFSNFAVECYRNSKKHQNVQKLIFSEKLDNVFQTKHEFVKIPKDSKIVVECDWNITLSQNVHFFVKIDGFLEKKQYFKNRKNRKFVVESNGIKKKFSKRSNFIFYKKK